MAERVSKDNFDEALKDKKLVLVDFYSDTCIPCKKLNPVLSEVEEELKDSIKVLKVNVNYDMELAERFDVMGAPTLILFKNDEEISSKTGFQTKEDLTDWIQSFGG